jgi:hypothetical protein
MTEDQRYEIGVHLDNGLSSAEIRVRLLAKHPDNALSIPSINRWIREIRCGRKDLRNIPSRGRPRDEGILPAVERAFKEEPFASARAIAGKLHLATETPALVA